eukprot:3176764-Pleurochrysis_carterae.AAC.2
MTARRVQDHSAARTHGGISIPRRHPDRYLTALLHLPAVKDMRQRHLQQTQVSMLRNKSSWSFAAADVQSQRKCTLRITELAFTITRLSVRGSIRTRRQAEHNLKPMCCQSAKDLYNVRCFACRQIKRKRTTILANRSPTQTAPAFG